MNTQQGSGTGTGPASAAASSAARPPRFVAVRGTRDERDRRGGGAGRSTWPAAAAGSAGGDSPPAARPEPIEGAVGGVAGAVDRAAEGSLDPPAPVESRAHPPVEPAAPAGVGGTGSHGLSRRELTALGPIAPLLDDPETTDVFVNGAAGAFVDRGAGAEPVPAWPRLDEQRLRRLAVAAIAAGGRHLDDASPSVDVRLGDGVRVHAVLPPVSVRGTAISVRAPRGSALALADLVRAGSCSEPLARELRACVRRRANLLVTGASGSGKTTLLAALLGLADPRDRIVLVEDLAELRVDHPHVVQLEARQANIEGAGGIALDRLVREALRMRPDRLVVGEVRGAEVRELLSALNTGHSGGAGTLHANSVDDVAARLEALGALAGLGPEALARQAASAIERVVHVERRAGARRVASIGVLELGPDGRLVSREIATAGAGREIAGPVLSGRSAPEAGSRPDGGEPSAPEIVELAHRRARAA